MMRPGLSPLFGILSAAAFFGVAVAPASAQIFTVSPDLYSTFTPSPTPAEAHEADGPIGVTQRVAQELQQEGFWIDGQHIIPSATVSSIYDDNIFATHAGSTGDVISHFRPAVDIDNAEQIVSYQFDLSGDFAEYAEHPSLNNLNGSAAFGIVANLAPTFRIESRDNFVVQHADPAGFVLPVANAATPHLPETLSFEQQIAVIRDVGLWGLQLGGSYAYSREQDVVLNGVNLPLSALNSNTVSVIPKVSYEIAPDVREFVQGEYQHQDDAEGALNSSTYSIVTGFDFELRRLIRGTFNIGYREHVYDTSGSSSVGGLTYNLNLAWYPTDLLTLTLTGSQDYSDSIITQSSVNNTGIPNIKSNLLNGLPVISNAKTIQAQADYSITDNVVVSGVGSYAINTYPGATREDDLLTTGASLLYIFSPNLVASAQYRYTMRTSTAAGFGYDRDQIGVALKWQY